MQSRLKLKFGGMGSYTTVHVLSQVKINFFWETVASVEVVGSRDINAAKMLAQTKLQAYIHSGFGDKGVIDL